MIRSGQHIKSLNRIMLFYQDTSQRGTFMLALDFMLPGTPNDIAAGDLDGDGEADLLEAAIKYQSVFVIVSCSKPILLRKLLFRP